MHSCLNFTHNVAYCVKSCVVEEVLVTSMSLILYFLNSLGLFFRPQISAKLLVHKIQSPQEWEALQSLTVCIYFLILTFSIAQNYHVMYSWALFVFAGS